MGFWKRNFWNLLTTVHFTEGPAAVLNVYSFRQKTSRKRGHLSQFFFRKIFCLINRKLWKYAILISVPVAFFRRNRKNSDFILLNDKKISKIALAPRKKNVTESWKVKNRKMFVILQGAFGDRRFSSRVRNELKNSGIRDTKRRLKAP